MTPADLEKADWKPTGRRWVSPYSGKPVDRLAAQFIETAQTIERRAQSLIESFKPTQST